MSRLDLTGKVSPAALTPAEAITRDAKRRLGYATRAERKAWLMAQMGRCVFSGFDPEIEEEVQRKLAVLSSMSTEPRSCG